MYRENESLHESEIKKKLIDIIKDLIPRCSVS